MGLVVCRSVLKLVRVESPAASWWISKKVMKETGTTDGPRRRPRANEVSREPSLTKQRRMEGRRIGDSRFSVAAVLLQGWAPLHRVFSRLASRANTFRRVVISLYPNEEVRGLQGVKELPCVTC